MCKKIKLASTSKKAIKITKYAKNYDFHVFTIDVYTDKIS